jgi:hypothetical protein
MLPKTSSPQGAALNAVFLQMMGSFFAGTAVQLSGRRCH